MRRLIPALLALALLAGCAPGASAAPKMEIAFEDDAVFSAQPGQSFYPMGTALDTVRTLNGSWIRVQALWSHLMPVSQAKQKTMPKKIRWNFTGLDHLVAQARLRGIRIEMTLTTPAPAWATGNHKQGTFRPNAKRYGAFVKVAVRHFRKTVKRFSLMNEPNWIGWLSPVKEQGKLYRALYMAGYKQARAQAPTAKIWMGETSAYREPGLSTAPLQLLRTALCVNKKLKPVKVKGKKCAPLTADGYAVHPYDWDHKPTYKYPGADNVTIGTLYRVTRMLDKLQKAKVLKVRGAKKMPVYLTEFGYRLTGKHGQPESKRAAYLKQALGIAQRNPRVHQFLQYQLIQPPDPKYFWQSFLIGTGGKLTPSYKAFLSWTTAAAKKGQIIRPRPF